MRNRIAASASFIRLCSDFDHAADVAVVLFCACCSPMRGWLRNASSQPDGGRRCQHSSAAANSFCSLAKGRIAVNFSAVQFKMQGEVTKEIDAVLAETGLPAKMLEVELTESTLMETTRSNSGVLEELRKRGVTIAIDDFGTGYSSLAYLRRFPVDRIKLTQEFIVDLVAGSGDAVIVQAAIGLARTLGADMIAEGVESEQQLGLLKFWGCGAAQGYYFARPAEVEAATRLLRRGRIDGGSVASRAEVPRAEVVEN